MQQAIEKLAEEVVQGAGFELLEIRMVSGVGHGVGQMQLFCGAQLGVRGLTADDCASISRQLSYRLEVEELDSWFSQGYRLEVSSPGLFRRLQNDKELQWALGRRIRMSVALDPEVDAAGRSGMVVEGILRGVDEENITVESADGDCAWLRSTVQNIRLDPELLGGQVGGEKEKQDKAKAKKRQKHGK